MSSLASSGEMSFRDFCGTYLSNEKRKKKLLRFDEKKKRVNLWTGCVFVATDCLRQSGLHQLVSQLRQGEIVAVLGFPVKWSWLLSLTRHLTPTKRLTNTEEDQWGVRKDLDLAGIRGRRGFSQPSTRLWRKCTGLASDAGKIREREGFLSASDSLTSAHTTAFDVIMTAIPPDMSWSLQSPTA